MRLILDGKLLAISYNSFSTYMDKDSIAVLQPLVMIHAGLSFLSVHTFYQKLNIQFEYKISIFHLKHSFDSIFLPRY